MELIVEFETLLQGFENNSIVTQYDYDYQEIRQLVETIGDDAGVLELHTVCRIAYSWMPTILKTIDDTAWHKYPPEEVFHRVRRISDFEEALDFIDFMAKVAPVNNSWVGTSKVLHFINPEWFPIWDSRVARVFSINSQHRVNRKTAYKDYVSFFQKCSPKLRERALVSVNGIIKSSCVGLKPVGETRAIEKILFFGGGNRAGLQ
jgi:hypothetical protein